MLVEAFAKINWTLNITGLRADGYHLLDMLMQPVSLADRITLLPAEELSLTVAGGGNIPADDRNLALRAAKLLRKETGVSAGAAIHLEKHIPSQAGMGGGSSDAAAVLTALNRLWSAGLSGEELEALGVRLGADVPFLIRGGLARTRGIGEQLESIPSCRAYSLLVLQPEGGLSTAEIFRAWHDMPAERSADPEAALSAILSGSVAGRSSAFANMLEPVSRRFCPEIGTLVRALYDNGADLAQMTGSGSAVFGVFSDTGARNRAAAALASRCPKCWCCETQEESIRFQEDA